MTDIEDARMDIQDAETGGRLRFPETDEELPSAFLAVRSMSSLKRRRFRDQLCVRRGDLLQRAALRRAHVHAVRDALRVSEARFRVSRGGDPDLDALWLDEEYQELRDTLQIETWQLGVVEADLEFVSEAIKYVLE